MFAIYFVDSVPTVVMRALTTTRAHAEELLASIAVDHIRGRGGDARAQAAFEVPESGCWLSRDGDAVIEVRENVLTLRQPGWFAGETVERSERRVGAFRIDPVARASLHAGMDLLSWSSSSSRPPRTRSPGVGGPTLAPCMSELQSKLARKLKAA